MSPDDPAPADWDALRQAAVEAMGHAYAPYSDYQVGVAGLVDDGRTVVGCNVENASYGLTLCAECAMVSNLHLSGGGKLTHVCCVDAQGDPIMPCGRCRQLLWEHGTPETELMTDEGVLTMAQVLPKSWSLDPPHDVLLPRSAPPNNAEGTPA